MLGTHWVKHADRGGNGVRNQAQEWILVAPQQLFQSSVLEHRRLGLFDERIEYLLNEVVGVQVRGSL